jgi:hypothetical protein
MRRRSTLAFSALLILWSSPALAREPFGEEPRSEPAPPGADSDPAPFIAPPPDLYYVTDTYVADVVTSNGPLTTYSTTTVHESTGSYARVLETVGTGEPSAYDGSAFNGRRGLADGRLVAGTYYENYVLTADGFVPVSIVFFQDDAELAHLLDVTPRRTATTAPPSTSSPSREQIRPGLSLLPVSSPLARLEVLRGRAVALWPRAFVDDGEVPVRSWTVIAGDAGEAVALGGSGAVPFRSSWRRLAPPGAAYELVFRVEVETPATGRRTVDTAIAIAVRSPALVD